MLLLYNNYIYYNNFFSNNSEILKKKQLINLYNFFVEKRVEYRDNLYDSSKCLHKYYGFSY